VGESFCAAAVLADIGSIIRLHLHHMEGKKQGIAKKPIFEKAALKSQKGAGLGRLSGNPIGGSPGRKVKRDWEASALAMPWPLSEVHKEQLRTAYVQGYAALDIQMTRRQASEAVKNLPKKFNGTINVSLDVFFLIFVWV
jgi:hypothetical protein